MRTLNKLSIFLLVLFSFEAFAQNSNDDTVLSVDAIDKLFAVELDDNNSYRDYGENKQESGCEQKADNLSCQFNKSFKVANKTLDEAAKAELDKVIKEIKIFLDKEKVINFAIKVHGNASEIRYSEKGGNEKLAMDRAKIVQSYLNQKLAGYTFQFATASSAVTGPKYETAKAGSYTKAQMEAFYVHQYVSMKIKVLKKKETVPTKPPGSYSCGDKIKVNGKGSKNYCGLVDNGKGYTAAIHVKGAKRIRIEVDAYQVPDRFVLEYDKKVIQDTNYISSFYTRGASISLIDANAVDSIRVERLKQVKAYIQKLKSLSSAQVIGKNDFVKKFYGVKNGACPGVAAGFVTAMSFKSFRDCVKNGGSFYTAKVNIASDDDYQAIMPSYMNRTDKSKNTSENNPHNELIEEIKDRITYPSCGGQCGTSWKGAVKKSNSHVHGKGLATDIYLNGVKQYANDFFTKGFRDVDPKEKKSIQSYARYKKLLDQHGCGEIKGKSPATLELSGEVIKGGADNLAYLKVYAPLVNMTVWSGKVICE